MTATARLPTEKVPAVKLYTFHTPDGVASFYADSYNSAVKQLAASGYCRIEAAFCDGLPIPR